VLPAGGLAGAVPAADGAVGAGLVPGAVVVVLLGAPAVPLVPAAPPAGAVPPAVPAVPPDVAPPTPVDVPVPVVVLVPVVVEVPVDVDVVVRCSVEIARTCCGTGTRAGAGRFCDWMVMRVSRWITCGCRAKFTTTPPRRSTRPRGRVSR
jgi:hypothetical protein